MCSVLLLMMTGLNSFVVVDMSTSCVVLRLGIDLLRFGGMGGNRGGL